MLYLNFFIIYSIIGFYFESAVFKLSKNHSHSGILHGPYTTIYGIGGVISLIINNYLITIKNVYVNFLISYFLFTIFCTLIEFIGGHLIHFLFKKDSWNYSHHKYHFGKYICLSYALIWGLLSIIFVKILNPFFIQIICFIPNYISITLLLIMILDFLFLVKKSH